MKRLLVIVLAGLIVQTGLAGKTADKVGNSRYADVSLETVVIYEASAEENFNQDQSFFALGKEIANRALMSLGFDLFPEIKQQEERVKMQTTRVREELAQAVSNRASQLRDLSEVEVEPWAGRAIQVSSYVSGATETITEVASEILAVQLVDLNRRLSLNAPVSGSETEISRWMGERSVGRLVK